VNSKAIYRRFHGQQCDAFRQIVFPFSPHESSVLVN
jgi:hypothetical protein